MLQQFTCTHSMHSRTLTCTHTHTQLNPQVGDLLRSMKLLRYTVEGTLASLKDIALDVNMNPIFLSAIEMLDDENYIGSDGRHVFICQKNTYVGFIIIEYECALTTPPIGRRPWNRICCICLNRHVCTSGTMSTYLAGVSAAIILAYIERV